MAPLLSWIFPARTPEERLWRALDKNQPEELERALNDGASAQSCRTGEPALVWAVRRYGNNGVDLVRALLAAGAKVDACDKTGHTALSYTLDVAAPAVDGVSSPSPLRPWNRKEPWRTTKVAWEGRFVIGIHGAQQFDSGRENGIYFRTDASPFSETLGVVYLAKAVMGVLLEAGASTRIMPGYLETEAAPHWCSPQFTANRLLESLIREAAQADVANPDALRTPTEEWRAVLAAVKGGSDPNKKLSEGKRALYCAAIANQGEVVEALLDLGAKDAWAHMDDEGNRGVSIEAALQGPQYADASQAFQRHRARQAKGKLEAVLAAGSTSEAPRRRPRM